MKKYIEISAVAYNSFFKLLLDKYKWEVEITEPISNSKVYTIYTEEPILNEICAALNSQITYAEHLIEQIEDAKEYF